MMAHTLGRLGASALLAGFLWFGLTQALVAAEETKSQREKKSSSKSEEVETARVSFRLPRYFASIIDDEQRAEIHEIQTSYHEKLAALQQELAELEAAQLKEMEGVLTGAQRKTLEEMRAGSSKEESDKRTSSKSKSSTSGSSKDSRKGSSRDD